MERPPTRLCVSRFERSLEHSSLPPGSSGDSRPRESEGEAAADNHGGNASLAVVLAPDVSLGGLSASAATLGLSVSGTSNLVFAYAAHQL